jgi:hypothetical protein
MLKGLCIIFLTISLCSGSDQTQGYSFCTPPMFDRGRCQLLQSAGNLSIATLTYYMLFLGGWFSCGSSKVIMKTISQPKVIYYLLVSIKMFDVTCLICCYFDFEYPANRTFEINIPQFIRKYL